MGQTGGCHCGAVRYAVVGEPQHVSLCHCSDCRRSAGAPVVSWAAFSKENFKVTSGKARSRNSSGDAYRHFCPDCGTGLWYTNETMLPGLVDIQTATLDDPETLIPVLHVQTAEELSWMNHIQRLPKYYRYPGMD